VIDTSLPAAREVARRAHEDPYRLGHRDHGAGPVEGAGHGETGPARKRIIVGYGFWIFLLSDIVMFACFFAAFAVGLSFAATNARSKLWTQVFLIITGLLGLAFVLMELSEFIGLASRGITPQRSGFLSAFFGLVGLHGLHVTLAGVWLATMLAQVQVKGFRPEIVHRLICFNLFWHALDIVWIGIFTIVYLIGAIT